MGRQPKQHFAPRDSSGRAIRLLLSRQPLIIGHRGCAAQAPENTLPALKMGLAAGADMVEVDYHHSRDGVPMVFHDQILDRTSNVRALLGRKQVRLDSLTASELQQLDVGSWFDPRFAGTCMMKLEAAIRFVHRAGSVALIEHKSGDARTCVQLLRSLRLLNEVIVISFDWQFLKAFHQLEPRQILGALGPAKVLADGTKPPRHSTRLGLRWLTLAEPTGARLIVWNRNVSRASVALAAVRGLPVWVYTVDRLNVARQLLQAGVSGIISNDPARIRCGT